MKEKARKFYLPDFIIRHARGIELLFVLMTLCSLFLMPFVRVNYDLTKYLPESAASKEGLDLMEEAFGYPGTARVMISDVSLYEAKRCKDAIEAIDGVDMVMWCDRTLLIMKESRTTTRTAVR